MGKLTLLLFVAVVASASALECSIENKAKRQKEFPDIRTKGKGSYKLSVAFTISNPEVKETNYFIEYYDTVSESGRVDVLSKMKAVSYYYYVANDEAFEVSGESCTAHNFTAHNPDFEQKLATDWLYKNDIRGPSAMFVNGFDLWNTSKYDTTIQMAYMGELQDDLVNGLKAQYWRHCRGNQTIDYYFTVDSHDDAFGFDNLKTVPLRVAFGESEEVKAIFPQTYDIMQFQPFIEFEFLNIPSGIGCVRRPDIDVPTIPDFSGKNIFTFADASYVFNGDHLHNYVNGFLYAEDKRIEHMAYFYTPFGSFEDKEQSPDGYMHVVYDTKHHYIYKIDLTRDTCEIGRSKSYKPQFSFPEYRGALDLTDDLLFGDSNEFSYVTDGKDRNYNVRTFEAISKNYPIINRTLEKIITTHRFLVEDTTMDSDQIVKTPPTSFELKFYEKGDETAKETLNINLYGYSTTVPGGNYIFNVEKCFKNDDDYLFATFGFPAEPSVLKKIQNETPSIQSNMMSTIMLNSELNELRIPYIFVDFSDMLYVSVMILDKPPVELDFMPVESKKTIEGAAETKGIQDKKSCANYCLESECWAYSLCGATCALAIGDKGVIANSDNCELYRRFENSSFIPTKQKAAESLEYLVKGEGLKLLIPIPDDPSGEPLTFKATYFEISNPSESEGVFSLFGKDTNPRLRVYKTGYKLSKTGENVKNLGKLRYEDCQRLCLDFKQCETVSYCLKESECVITDKYGDDIDKSNIVPDNNCNLLTRKYADHFDRSSGNTIASAADKTLQLKSPEECAKACLQEKSFDCLSFDLCPAYPDSCLLKKVHKLDLKSKVNMKPDFGCGHYSKKFSYTFKKQDKTRSVGMGVVAATNITLEQCAKLCEEYTGTYCYGFDFCEDATLTSSSCIILNDDPGKYSTTPISICSHFLQSSPRPADVITKGKAAWVGILCFFVAAVVGVLLTFGIAYCRANRQVK